MMKAWNTLNTDVYIYIYKNICITIVHLYIQCKFCIYIFLCYYKFNSIHIQDRQCFILYKKNIYIKKDIFLSILLFKNLRNKQDEGIYAMTFEEKRKQTFVYIFSSSIFIPTRFLVNCRRPREDKCSCVRTATR